MREFRRHKPVQAIVGIGFLVGLALPTEELPEAPQAPPVTDRAGRWHGRIPGAFEPNIGQAEDGVAFVYRDSGYQLHLAGSGAMLYFRDVPAAQPVRMRFNGANATAKIEGRQPLDGRVNFLLGDRARWRTDVPTYAAVVYKNLYPGINLIFRRASSQLEYDFHVAPGADPSLIRIAFDGARISPSDPPGDVVLRTARGEIRHHRPRVYQDTGRGPREIPARWMVLSPRLAAFDLGGYDRRLALLIDPLLTYSSYLGGRADDEAKNIAVDSSGNVYVLGTTTSTNYPTSGPLSATNSGLKDVVVTKLNPAGTAVVYSTYIGGRASDEGTGIAVDRSGNAYVTGFTISADFPTTSGVFQRTGGGFADDAFVLKLNTAGNGLLYSSYLGGGLIDQAHSIAIDSTGGAYVAGRTFSMDFPLVNSVQRSRGADAFVSKISLDGSSLVYSTALGGNDEDTALGIAVDGSGSAYVTGLTRSRDFPVVNAFDSSNANADVFVSKLSSSGSALVYSTYLGGSASDIGYAIAVDASGSAYVTGSTQSSDFPIPVAEPFQATLRGAGDAFVVRFNPSGSALVYATFLGGRVGDAGTDIAVDSGGNAYLTGVTQSEDFPVTPGAFQTSYAGSTLLDSDSFLVKLNAAGSALRYSTYLGGSGRDNDFLILTPGGGLAIDSAGNAYLAGRTSSTNFPTTAGVLQRTGGGALDAFVTKFDFASGPHISAGGMVNGASFLPGALAPGEIITIFGVGLGPPSLVSLRLSPAGILETDLSTSRVFFDGLPAPLIFARADQVSAIVPYFVDGKLRTQVQVQYQGIRSEVEMIPVVDAAPGLFTLDASGRGPGAILNEDSTVNSSQNPAARGSIVVLYGTGEGQTEPRGTDGKLATGALPQPRLPVAVQIGGRPAEVLYAGAAPGLVAGVIQVNARVPEDTSPGNAVPVSLVIGTRPSQPNVTLAVR